MVPPPKYIYLMRVNVWAPLPKYINLVWASRSLVQAVIQVHDDVIKWKHFPRYWPFVRGIHRSLVNSPYKDQWRRAVMFSLICGWMNGWVNNREAGDSRPHRAHYNATVMQRFPEDHHKYHVQLTPLICLTHFDKLVEMIKYYVTSNVLNMCSKVSTRSKMLPTMCWNEFNFAIF